MQNADIYDTFAEIAEIMWTSSGRKDKFKTFQTYIGGRWIYPISDGCYIRKEAYQRVGWLYISALENNCK